MRLQATSIAALVLIAGVTAYALLREDKPAERATSEPASHAEMPAEPNDDPSGGALPPNHPSIGEPSNAPSIARSTDEPPAITWTVPKDWQTVPSASSMRIATYRVPRAAGVKEDADVSVIRAGGTTDANIQRWIGQFEDAGRETRTEKTVRGVKVSIVEVAGVYGGMMPMGGAAPGAGAHEGWALLGAVVEVGDMPYFFKLTGPSASVRAARRSFDSLVDSIHPAASPPM